MSEPIDVVWGADAIGKLIQATPRKTYGLLEAGALPARKVGKQWVASRSTLEKFLMCREYVAGRSGEE